MVRSRGAREASKAQDHSALAALVVVAIAIKMAIHGGLNIIERPLQDVLRVVSVVLAQLFAGHAQRSGEDGHAGVELLARDQLAHLRFVFQPLAFGLP